MSLQIRKVEQRYNSTREAIELSVEKNTTANLSEYVLAFLPFDKHINSLSLFENLYRFPDINITDKDYINVYIEEGENKAGKNSVGGNVYSFHWDFKRKLINQHHSKIILLHFAITNEIKLF